MGAVDSPAGIDLRDDASPRGLDLRLARLDHAHPSSPRYADRTAPDGGRDSADIRPFTDAEHAEHVFIIFNRLHTRIEYAGNGIGLAICKKIIERHRGRIKALPREGGGTIFKFTLPAGKPDEIRNR